MRPMHEICADELGEGERALKGFLCGLGHPQEQESNQGNGDLNADRILAVTEAAADFEGLLDPSEEQFDGPSPLVKVGDFLGRSIEVVAQDAQQLAGLGLHPHLAHRIAEWILAALGASPGQQADAVGQNGAAGVTIVDTCTRLSPAIDARRCYRGSDVVETLERAAQVTGYPKTIRLDNGPEFISRELDLWAFLQGVTLDFSVSVW